MTKRARESFFYSREDGSEGFVAAGAELDDDHEAVAGRDELFVQPVEAAKPAPPKRTTKG